MAVSKNRPKYKVKKKQANIKKQKLKEMENIQNNQPINYTYHKDATHVKVPLAAWQALNSAAEKLRPMAMFVHVMEQIGNEHMMDGTLLPIFKDDIEPVPGSVGPDGRPQQRIKDSFWIRKETPLLVNQNGDPVDTKTEVVSPPSTTEEQAKAVVSR